MIPFRYRGEQPSRMEVLSDAVFGFSLTLLVVSLEVPRTFGELLNLVYGFVPFALSFMLFVHIWYLHSRFFKRYGLDDVPTVWLNSVLLFLVMFFVYPLKFLVNVVVQQMSGQSPTVMGPEGELIQAIAREDAIPMLLLFSSGFVAIHATFVLMHWRAFRLKEKLGLNRLEIYDTRNTLGEHAIYVMVGLISIVMSVLGGLSWTTEAGWFYAVLGPVMGVYGYIMGRRREKLELVVSDDA